MPNTPSIIARPTATGWEGRYVHNNGHPETRLPLLHALHDGPFATSHERMTRFLIDDHPAGWSQLGHDPTTDTGWINPCPPIGDNGFRCYCHGQRREEPCLITDIDAEPDLYDFVYVLHPHGIQLYESSSTTWWTGPVRAWNIRERAA
ncbi:hypothetical protein OHB04_22715 [Streptomyces sp. NBC_01775]|uniref:hypothetical protein n=1 Tax=Streptomyces sp. NBC_01775 TaxID=2975939 RepID=UPI002DD7F29B|nr:hypothetical protein [Streptomyces sp. NBC_01775]WSB78307.1 hypothetical protein OHB04_22715 [Streptomyces sp. NBC_01775]